MAIEKLAKLSSSNFIGFAYSLIMFDFNFYN